MLLDTFLEFSEVQRRAPLQPAAVADLITRTKKVAVDRNGIQRTSSKSLEMPRQITLLIFMRAILIRRRDA